MGFGHRMRTELPEDGLEWRGGRCRVNGLGAGGASSLGRGRRGRPRVEQRPGSRRTLPGKTKTDIKQNECTF